MMRMWSGFFIVFSCLTVALYANNVDFKTCPKVAGNDASIVKAVRVEKCKGHPCELKRGETYSFEIDFVPNKDAEKVDVAAFGVLIESLEVPWPGMKTNVCENEQFNIKCPIQAKEKVTYINKVEVLSSYPTAKVSVHWKIKLNGVLASCVVVDVKIVA